MKITKKDIDWCDEPILGYALILLDEDVIDFNNKPIEHTRFYEVGKHKASGKVAIVLVKIPPTGKTESTPLGWKH